MQNLDKETLKNDITKEGDELRKSMLDKLFNLNTVLSAAFLVLYQLNQNSFKIGILNILPFCCVLLILLYQLIDLRALGYAYYKLDDWQKGNIKTV